jgi:hypothetical protein
MSTIATPERFTALPGKPVIASAITALEEHGFSVEVVDGLDPRARPSSAAFRPGCR